MEMLFSTKAHIIGFEADPRNAAQVTNTLMGLPKELRDRVSFFPMGLSHVSETGVIHVASRNRGNSVVNVAIKDFSSDKMEEPIPIVLDRLDAVFSNATTKSSLLENLLLIKMDVQGYECNVIDGGLEMFRAAKGIKTEVALRWLEGQGCSGEGLLQRIEKAGFHDARSKALPSSAYELELIKGGGGPDSYADCLSKCQQTEAAPTSAECIAQCYGQSSIQVEDDKPIKGGGEPSSFADIELFKSGVGPDSFADCLSRCQQTEAVPTNAECIAQCYSQTSIQVEDDKPICEGYCYDKTLDKIIITDQNTKHTTIKCRFISCDS